MAKAGAWFGIAAVAAVVVAGLWFAAGGVAGGPRALPWLTARPFAHRGDHLGGASPENSLAAFRAAVEGGFGIELDVRLTSDDHAVVFHDERLQRLTGDPRRVEDVGLEELRALRLRGTAERVPTLREALDAVGGHVPVLVEVKSPGRPGPLEAAVVRDLAGYAGPVAVISFDPRSLARVAALAPHLPRGQLSGAMRHGGVTPLQSFALRHLLLCVVSRPDFIAYELGALPSWATRLQRLLGRPLVAYTPETAADADRASRLADNYIGNPGSLPRRGPRGDTVRIAEP